eukprot:COSAG02_NODE_4952_length_4788_cov_252.664747_3_plen_51_part_00
MVPPIHRDFNTFSMIRSGKLEEIHTKHLLEEPASRGHNTATWDETQTREG